MYQSLQGNIGLGKAIEYFTSHGIPVAIPLNDTQPYDLIADFDNSLQRISVKTSRNQTSANSYSVQLRNTGGNRTGTVRQVSFDNSKCDYVFIYTADEKLYLIPSKDITVSNAISVGNKYQEYLVQIRSFEDFIKDEVKSPHIRCGTQAVIRAQT